MQLPKKPNHNYSKKNCRTLYGSFFFIFVCSSRNLQRRFDVKNCFYSNFVCPCRFTCFDKAVIEKGRNLRRRFAAKNVFVAILCAPAVLLVLIKQLLKKAGICSGASPSEFCHKAVLKPPHKQRAEYCLFIVRRNLLRRFTVNRQLCKVVCVPLPFYLF